MKKIILTAAIFFSLLSLQKANAQVSLSINIGSQPEWGPTGYDRANYYYLPDIDTYYDVNAHQYVYLNNNVWVHTAALPARYRNYDVYHSYKVVVNDSNPWTRNNVYRKKYANYKGRHDQVIIRDSKDVKYRNHWNDNKNNHRDDHRGDNRNDHRDHRN